MSKRRGRSKRSLVFKLALVFAVPAGGAYYYTHYIQLKRNSLEIDFRHVQVSRDDLEVNILSTGTVEPQNRVEIKPPVPGRVEQVLVKEGQAVRKGQVLAWMSSTERAALLDAASAKGPKELKKWESNYKPTPILAPIDGMVIHRNVESGQSFTNVDSVMVMSDRLTVRTQVDETDIAEIKQNQKTEITLDAYPNHKIPGRVEHIAYDAKTLNNVTTYVIDVLPGKIPEFMRSGMTANVTFHVASKNQVLTVPNESLHVQNKQYSVILRSPVAPRGIEQPVEVGLTDGKKTEVLQGLSEGDTILIAEVKPHGKDSGRGGSPLSLFGKRDGGVR